MPPMIPIESRTTFRPDDVLLLLTDITGKLVPQPTEERERLIQSGVHYSEMLPLEYIPSDRYILEYYRALDTFADAAARAVAVVAEKIYAKKQRETVLVSLARAGTPVGVLIKRYLQRQYDVNATHYTISIVRGRGLDTAAMRHILERHSPRDIQFVDGWIGKGAVLEELASAVRVFVGEQDKRTLLAVLADPANVTDMCGTHDDIPIASSFLNSTVCGLMSRTVIRPGIGENEFHGVAFYDELKHEDRTYEFIDRIESCISELGAPGTGDATSVAISGLESGFEEVRQIAECFGIGDINFIKPGIGEATRVLLRRVPDMLLIAEKAETVLVSHLIQLAEEKNVPVLRYPLRRYSACGIIKALTPDL